MVSALGGKPQRREGLRQALQLVAEKRGVEAPLSVDFDVAPVLSPGRARLKNRPREESPQERSTGGERKG